MFLSRGRGEPEIAPIMPKVYYTEIDKDTEIFLFVMEFFDRAKMGMMDEMGSDLWDREKICTVSRRNKMLVTIFNVFRFKIYMIHAYI